MAQKKTTYKYHLIKTFWDVWVGDDKIGRVEQVPKGWTCGLHHDHVDRTAAADCVYDRSKYVEKKCKVHPEYLGDFPPRSTAPKCTCWEVFDASD